jgi:hypothetical protein
VYYGYLNIEVWTYALGCGDCDGDASIRESMKGLTAYMKAHPGIKGIIFTRLQFDVSFYL